MVSYLRLVPLDAKFSPPVEWDDDQALLPLPLDPPAGALAPQRVPSSRRRVRAALVEALQLALEFRARRVRPPRPRPASNEPPLEYLEIPATRGDCRGPGICPVFRCRHNLALRVKSSGAIKVDGGGPGTTIRVASHASPRKIDRIVDIIVARAEELGSLCSLDLAEAGTRSIPEVAEILHVSEEIIRQEFLAAAHEIDIAQARERRREQRHIETKPPAPAPLVQIRRKP